MEEDIMATRQKLLEQLADPGISAAEIALIERKLEVLKAQAE